MSNRSNCLFNAIARKMYSGRILIQLCQVLRSAQPIAWIISLKTMRWFTVSWTKICISRRPEPQECFRQLEDLEKIPWGPKLLKENIFQNCVKQEMLQEKVNQMPPYQPQHRAFQMSSLKIFYLLFQIQSRLTALHGNIRPYDWGMTEETSKPTEADNSGRSTES